MTDVSSLSASIDGLVQKYRLSLRKPITSLENRKTTLKVRLNVLSEMKMKLNSFFNQVKDMSVDGASTNLIGYKVSSSNTNVVSATASSADALGSYSLSVSSLAKSDSLISGAIERDSNSIVDTAGAGTHLFSVSINGQEKEISVNLSEGEANNSVLTKISTAVNGLGLKLKASVIAVTSTTSRLVLNSTETGSTNAISLYETGEGLLSSIGLSQSVLNSRTVTSGNAGGYLYNQVSELDARFKLNGIDIVRSSNMVNDVISGLTFELKSVQSENELPITLSVMRDTEKLKLKIQKFIEEYNSVIKFIKAKTAVDGSTGVRQILSGDSVFINLRLKLRTTVEGFVTNLNPENPGSLSQIGITAAKDGTLSISNSSALDEALTNNPNKVTDLFNSSNGIAVRLKDLLQNFISSGGVVDKSNDGINTQIKNLDNRIKLTEVQINKKVNNFRNDLNKIQNILSMITQQQQLVRNIMAGW